MKQLLLYILVVMLTVQADAQRPQGNWGADSKTSITGKIDGDVLDAHTGAPVDFATVAVYVPGTDKIISGTTTNEKGHFKLTELKLGAYEVHVTFLGYSTNVIEDVKLTKRKPDWHIGEIYLETDDIILDEVEITEEASLIENRVDRIVYNADKDLTSQGGDAADILRKVPLVEVDFDGNVSMRGSSNIQILINNRPSGMFAADVAEALRMIPADQIKTVEVITAPSARYDAEGTAGIINIVTKKKNIDGITGSVNMSVGTRHNRQSGNLSMGKGRLGVNLGGSLVYSWPSTGTNTFFREDIFEGSTRTLEQNGETESTRVGYGGNGSLFYDINAYNSINSSFNIRGSSYDQESEIFSNYSDPGIGLMQSYVRSTSGDRGGNGWEWNTDYVKTFERPGQELVFAVQIDGNNNNTESIYTQESEIDSLELLETNNNDGNNLQFTLQSDYIHPFSDKVTLEIGAKSVLRDIDSDYRYDVFDAELNQYINDPDRTDLFNYNQDVYAGYTSFNIKLDDKTSMIAGARYEHTVISGEYRDFDNSFSNNYGNLVPSFIINRKVKQFNALKFAYNQRIQRPSLRYINPFINTSDQRNISFGNPDLAPELSHQLELGYTAFIKGTVVNFSIYYRHTEDEINSILEVNEDGVSVTSFRNIGRSNNYGANIFGSVTLWKKLTLRGSIDANWFEITSGDANLELQNDGLQYRARLSGGYKFDNGYSAEFFGFFNSPRRTIQGNNPSFSMFNMGLRKEFKNKRGSIGLSMTNPFSEFKSFKSDLSGPDFTQTSEFKRPFRSFGVNFRYQFGKLDFKQRERRSKIRNDDLKQGEGGEEGQMGR